MRRILLIEDDPGMAHGLRYNLEAEGYEVVGARDGEEGLALARDPGADLILLDVMLPLRSGFEVLEELRAGGDATPVILLSSRAAEADRVRGLKLGADDYVVKPFGLKELLARIRARVKSARRVAALHTAMAATNRERDPRRVLATLVGKALALTGAERGMVVIGGERIEIARDRAGTPLRGDVRFSTTIARRVYESGKPEALLDAGDEPVRDGASISDLQLRHVLCAPLRAGKRHFGVLYADSRVRASGFARSDLEIFATLAAQCGATLERAAASRKKARMEQELHEAQGIQRAMLPRGTLVGDGIEIAGLNRSCEETGGDYFDYLALPGRRVALVIGDVVGHGVGAALCMAAARSLLRAFLPHSLDPAAVLAQVNASLVRDMPDGTFMSLFLGLVDTRGGALRYASAGHNPALVQRRDGRCEQWDKTGPALGLVPRAQWDVVEAEPLADGDLLLLYTDGITEAMNGDHELFGAERLRERLAAHRREDAARIAEQLAADVDDFTGGAALADDRSLVVVKGSVEASSVGTSSLQA